MIEVHLLISDLMHLLMVHNKRAKLAPREQMPQLMLRNREDPLSGHLALADDGTRRRPSPNEFNH